MDRGGGQEQIKLIAKAVEYSDKVSWKEKHYIKSMEARLSSNPTQSIKELEKIVERYPEEKEAFYHLGMVYEYLLQESEEAIRQFNKAIEIDPLYKDPYNILAYIYHDIGDFEKSIWAINKYISLAPDEANPYDIRAGFYALDGKIDQAIESFKKALEIKPDFLSSLYMLGHMYLFKREYVKAESCYKELSSSSEKDIRSQGRTALAFIPLYQGKFKQALEVLDDGIAADRMEQVSDRMEQKVEGWNSRKHFLKAEIYEEKKNLNLALKEVEKGMEIFRRAYPKYYGQDHYARLLAKNDDFDKAEEVAKALKKDIEGKDRLMHYYWHRYLLAAGYIASARGSFEESLINFEKAAKDVPYFCTEYMLAKAYLESGRLGEAVAAFEKILSRYGGNRVFNAIQAVKAHYLLGLAYEKSGWTKKAIGKFEEFLEIWKDADPGILEVEDAKERLNKLRVKSRE